jgi:hypothetical protein
MTTERTNLPVKPSNGQTAVRYPRAVISTGRRPAEPAPAVLDISRAQVQTLSRALKDADWYTRRRLAAH